MSHRRYRRSNPVAHTQPDLFGGESSVRVSLEELSDQEIKRLPLQAFSYEELEELADRDRALRRTGRYQRKDLFLHSILKNTESVDLSQMDEDTWDLLEHYQHILLKKDPEADRRIRSLTEKLDDIQQQYDSPSEDYILQINEDVIDMMLNDLDMGEIRLKLGDEREDLDDFIESYVADGYGKDQVEEAVLAAFRDINNYFTDAPADEYIWAFIKACTHDHFFFDADAVEEMVEGMSEIEIKAAIDDADSGEIVWDVEWFVKQPNRWGPRKGLLDYQDIEVDMIGPFCVDLDPNMNAIQQDVAEALGEVEGEPEWEEPTGWDPRRVLHTWPDGTFLYELSVEELPWEGRKMRHCVGKPGMGYGRAVHTGQIKIYSIRTEANRPKFTIEVKVDGHGRPLWVKQFKGTANRLPGTGRKTQEQANEEMIKAFDTLKILGVEDDMPDDLEKGHDAFMQYEQHRPIRNPAPHEPPPACGRHSGEKCGGFCLPYRP